MSIDHYLDYKTIRVLNKFHEYVEGLENIILKNENSVIIGGGKKVWYREISPIPENGNKYEIVFSDISPSGNWESMEAVEDLGDGYYKICYNLHDDAMIERATIFINDGIETEYAKEILIDYEEMDRVLEKTKTFVDQVSLNETGNKLVINGEKFSTMVNLPEPLKLPDQPKILASYMKEVGNLSVNSSVDLAQNTLNQYRVRHVNLDLAIGYLEEIHDELNSMVGEDWEEDDKFTLPTDTVPTGRAGSRVINDISNTADEEIRNLEKGDIILIGKVPYTIEAIKHNSMEPTFSLTVEEVIKFDIAIDSIQILSSGSGLKKIYERILALIDLGYISSPFEIRAKTISESKINVERIATSLQREKRKTIKDIRTSVDFLQKTIINNLPDLNELFNLKLTWSNKYSLIKKFIVRLFRLEDDVNLSEINHITEGSSYLYAEDFKANYSNRIVSVQDYVVDCSFKQVDKKNLTITGINDDAITFILDDNETINVNKYKEGFGSVIEHQGDIFYVKELTSNAAIVSPSMKNYSPTGLTYIYKMYKEECDFSPYKEIYIPVNLSGVYVAFLTSVDIYDRRSDWSFPRVIDCKHTLIESNDPELNKKFTVQQYLDRFLVELPPIEMIKEQELPIRPNIPEIQSSSIIDILDEHKDLESSVEQHREDLNNLIKFKRTREHEIERTRIEYLSSIDSGNKFDKLKALNEKMYQVYDEDETEEEDLSLEGLVNRIIDKEYLVNYLDRPTHARFFCNVVIEDNSPNTQILRYRLRYFVTDKDYNKLDNTGIIIEGAEVNKTGYDPFNDTYTFENVNGKLPLYARTLRFPVVIGQSYKFEVCAVSANHIQSKWSDSVTKSVSLPSDSIENYTSAFIETRITKQMLTLNNSIITLQGNIEDMKKALDLGYSSTSLLGDIIADYDKAGHIWKFLIQYENSPMIAGYSIRVHYRKKAMLTYWKTIKVGNILDLMNAKDIAWVMDENDLIEFLKLFIYNTLDLSSEELEDFNEYYVSGELPVDYEDLGLGNIFSTTNLTKRLGYMSSYLQFDLILHNNAQFAIAQERVTNELQIDNI